MEAAVEGAAKAKKVKFSEAKDGDGEGGDNALGS